MQLIDGAVLKGGLFIEVKVWLSPQRRAFHYRKGMQIPPAVPAVFIIDTGADRSMVSEQTMRTLALAPTSQTRVVTSADRGVAQPCDVYDVSLDIQGRDGMHVEIAPVAVLGRHLLNDSIDGMLGRDVLDRAVLIYDGPGAEFSLRFKHSRV